MRFNLDIDYKLKEKALMNAEVTKDYIWYAIQFKYRNLMNLQQKKRIANRIMRKIDESITSKIDYVEFDEKELDFIKDCFQYQKLSFPANVSRYVIVLEDYISTL